MYLSHNTDNRKGIKLFMYHLWNEKALIKRKRLEMGEAERRGSRRLDYYGMMLCRQLCCHSPGP